MTPPITTKFHFFPLLHTIGTRQPQCKQLKGGRHYKTFFNHKELADNEQDMQKEARENFLQIKSLQKLPKKLNEV